MSRSKQDRMEKMMAFLREKQMAHLSDLSALLGVSEMTVRRYAGECGPDVSLMGSHVIFLSGAAGDGAVTYEVSQEAVRNPGKKERIGRKAAAMVEEEDVIFIDAGTTTPFLARQIPDHIRFTAVCCSLNVFMMLSQNPNCTILLNGGKFHRDSQIFSSRHTLDVIRDIRITKAFISAAGISEKLGLTCFNPYETDLKKEVIKYSHHVYVVADSTKLDTVKIAFFADITDTDTLITDTGITPAHHKWLGNAGIQVVTA
ncbi:MAG: DeoR/GlpR family DNA-binding transcription regulator [Desulfobacter sp.]